MAVLSAAISDRASALTRLGPPTNGARGAVRLVRPDADARRKERRRLASDLYYLRRQRTAALAQEQFERCRRLAERVDMYNDEVRLLAARADAAPFRAPEVEALVRRRSELVGDIEVMSSDRAEVPEETLAKLGAKPPGIR